MQKISYALFVTIAIVLTALGTWLSAFGISNVGGNVVICLSFVLSLALPKFFSIDRGYDKASTLLLDIVIGISVCLMMLDHQDVSPWVDVFSFAALAFAAADFSAWLFSKKQMIEVEGVKTVPFLAEAIILMSMSVWLSMQFFTMPRSIIQIVLWAIMLLAFAFSLTIIISCFGTNKCPFKEFRLGLSLDIPLASIIIYDLFSDNKACEGDIFLIFVLVLLFTDILRAFVSRHI